MEPRARHIKKTSYAEDIFLLNCHDGIGSDEQDAITRALTNNSAVGIVVGAYDEGLTISMASELFLHSLGYTDADIAQNAHRSLLSFVYEDDRELFEGARFAEFEGSFEFRAVAKDGGQHYVFAYKTDTVSAQGAREWVLSARLSKESVAANQLRTGLNRLVVRYAVCDLESDTYDFHDLGKGKRYPAHGSYKNDLVAGMVSGLKMLSGPESIEAAMTPENLRRQLKGLDDVYTFDYVSADGKHYCRMHITPLNFKGGKLASFVMFAIDTTETRLMELRAQKALQEAYDAANRANEAKSQFLSNMSHDIRTPMNAIIGMTAIASAHVDDRERTLDALGKITNSSRHLLSLINEVLDMSRIENGKLSLNNEEFSLPDLVDNMIEMVKPQILARSHKFEVRIQNIEHENVIGDSLRIQQVFINIVGNAVKYTPDGGSITLSISEKPTHNAHIGCYVFTVADTGIGMDQEFVKHIFDPFSRADNAASGKAQGTGLGMSIAKNIVSMMDGDITVSSKLGCGTTVEATIFLQLQEEDASNDALFADLPVLVVDDDEISCESTVDTLESIGMKGEWVSNGPDAVDRVTEKHEAADDFYAVILDWKMPGMDGIQTARAIRGVVGPDIPIIMLTAYDFGQIEEEARAAGITCFVSKPLFRSRLRSVFAKIASGDGGAAAGSESEEALASLGDYSGKRVLLVEDNLINREIMNEILAETKVEVDTAVNGKLAVDAVTEHPEGYYDLVFMDIQMPVMDGYEATMAIRSLPDGKGATLPIVALTANAFAEDVVMAKNAGVNEHLAKPVDLEKLAEVMRDLIG